MDSTERIKYRYKTFETIRPNRKRKKLIVEFILRYADSAVPLLRRHVQEAAEIVIERKPKDKKERLPFRYGKPGPRWIRGSYDPHKNQLKYAAPRPHEA